MTEPAKVRIFKPPKKKKEIMFRVSHKKFLLAFVGRPYGLTDEELAAQTGAGQTNARCRRIELATMGMIDNGTKRMSNRGRAASVWTLSKTGIQKIKELNNERT